MTDLHTPHSPHDHKDEGSLQDLIQQVSSRRKAMFWLAGASLTAGFASACGGGGGSSTTTVSVGSSSSSSSSSASSASSSSSSSSTAGTCTEYDDETNGPYPGDGSNTASGSVVNVLTLTGIVRSDIRTSIGAYSGTAPGVPLSFTITLVDAGTGCQPLANHAIYIWHCTRDGYYSLYTLTSQNYLRGVQVTDANGQCTFTTIFPGCYSGRMPHIHVEVYESLSKATSYANALKTTQFAIDRTTCQSVYNNVSGYSASISNLAGITFSSDNVFSDNSAAQLAACTLSLIGDTTSGYTGTVTLAI